MALNPDMGQDSNTEMDPRIVDQMCRAARDAAEKVMRRRLKTRSMKPITWSRRRRCCLVRRSNTPARRTLRRG